MVELRRVVLRLAVGRVSHSVADNLISLVLVR